MERSSASFGSMPLAPRPWRFFNFESFALPLAPDGASRGGGASEVCGDMPELLRSIAARLREVVGNRRRAQRYRVRLACSVSLADPKSSAHDSRRAQKLDGYTRDLSATGIALVMPAIRIGGNYLSGEGRTLLVVLELPVGSVQILVTSVRYERLEEDDTEQGYLIGTQIKEMSESDRARFTEYLRSLR